MEGNTPTRTAPIHLGNKSALCSSHTIHYMVDFSQPGGKPTECLGALKAGLKILMSLQTSSLSSTFSIITKI